MNNYIKVKNFKKYIETPEIALDELNYFVGTNSSGKSTLVKAYMLITKFILSDKLYEIEFTSDYYKDLNINDFERQKCKFSSNSDKIVIELGYNNLIFNLELISHERSNYATVSNYSVYDTVNDIVYEFKYNPGRTTKELHSVNFETNEPIYEDQLNEYTFQGILMNNDKYINDIIKLIEFKINETEDVDKLNRLNEHLRTLENSQEYVDIKLKSSSGFITYDSFKKCAREVLFSGNLLDNDYNSWNLTSIIRYYRILNLNNKRINDRDNEFEVVFSLDSFNDKILFKVPNGLDLSIKLSEIFKKINSLNSIYLPLNFRKYSNLNSIIDKTNDLAQLVHNFTNSNIFKKGKSNEFIKYWIGKEQFNIGNDFEINFYGGEAYEILIHENGVKIPLVDKGTGNIQIFKILIIVATYLGQSKKMTLILEEPELNLHPSLQSKLADLFSYINNELGFKIIVETHSEYLIRRLQVLSIHEKLDKSKLSLTYFPTEINEDPYLLKIRDDGSLDKNFGSGFLDEAGNHMLELMKFNMTSKN